MATPGKQGFPWIDGQFINDFYPSDRAPDTHIIAARDQLDGEIRIRVRRMGSHAETNEVEIGLSKDGMLTTFDRYDS